MHLFALSTNKNHPMSAVTMQFITVPSASLTEGRHRGLTWVNVEWKWGERDSGWKQR